MVSSKISVWKHNEKKKSKLVINFRLKEVYLLKFQRQAFVESDTYQLYKIGLYFHFTPTIVITDYFCCVSRKRIPILVVLGPIKELQILQEAFQTKFLFCLLLLTILFIGCICFNVEKSYYICKKVLCLFWVSDSAQKDFWVDYRKEAFKNKENIQFESTLDISHHLKLLE